MAKHILKTAAEVAMRRTAAAYWNSRLEVGAWHCEKAGQTWIATGPCGQRFEFTKTEQDDVLVFSQSGGIYLLMVSDDTGEMTCDCPQAAAVITASTR